ncbi:DUF2913 family protein [Aeromonas bivalvium]|uniref:DUF2913 family protein n=1 Tax=Aeromonas bivalvium TaxID=440079 RepID=UPI0038CFB57C
MSDVRVQTYNQALLEMASASLAELARTGAGRAPRTQAQESHFLSLWLADSLKEKRFSRLVMEDLKGWVQQARTQGAGADLKGLLSRIVRHYSQAAREGLGARLMALLDECEQAGWQRITEYALDGKARLASQGQASIVICAAKLASALAGDELVAPLTLYVRGDEQQLARFAQCHGLLIGQGNKKQTRVKHHKGHLLMPANALPALALLAQERRI